jgi:glycosyltransferase involved in cell wall biosynthesis
MANILLVAEAYAPDIGGGVRYEVDLVHHLQELGHRVDVITVGVNGKIETEATRGGTVYRMRNHWEFDSARLSADMLPFFIRGIKEYDLMHFNAPNPMGEISYYFLRSLGLNTPRAVCFFHGEVVSAKRLHSFYNSWLLNSHLKACQRIIVSSPNILSSTNTLQRFRDKVRVIPFGIDTKKFSPARGWRADRAKNNPLKFLFVGRLVRYKGVFELLNAFRRVPGSLEIVGDGPLKESLVSTAVENQIEDRVHFRGKISDAELIRSYRNADVIVLPSIDRGEGFGYVLAEGMACGAAAISTELGTGTSFVNQNNVSGVVVPPLNPEALAEAMNFLNRNRETLAEYRTNAVSRIRKQFSISTMLTQTLEMYRDIGVSL